MKTLFDHFRTNPIGAAFACTALVSLVILFLYEVAR